MKQIIFTAQESENLWLNFLKKLEQQINDFIKGKTVVDIKYQLSMSKDDEYYSAMVIYDDWISNYSTIVNLSKPVFLKGIEENE